MDIILIVWGPILRHRAIRVRRDRLPAHTRKVFAGSDKSDTISVIDGVYGVTGLALAA